MDQRIERKTWTRRRMTVALALAGLVTSAVVWAKFAPMQGSISVGDRQLELGEVKMRSLAETIALRGSIVPRTTVYLDAIQGGRVEKVLAHEGDLVQAGQVLLEMSNASLELDVITREAQIVEQLNNLQNTRLAIEQNRVSLQKDLANFEHQISKLEREVKQKKLLVEKQLVSKDEYLSAQEELDYVRKSHALTVESQKIDADMRKTLVAQLEASTAQQNHNLAIARKNLDSLVIRAPIAGRLSSFKPEIGESETPGARLGQIDAQGAFKLVASVDEFYLDNVAVGQKASANLGDERLQLTVSRIDPQVENGKFRIEFSLPEKLPAPVRRGQSLNLELALSEAADSLSIPAGGFTQDTGGHWVFVVDANSHRAERREIRLGRRNRQYLEVLDGLKAGEQVLVSPYGDLASYRQITIDKE